MLRVIALTIVGNISAFVLSHPVTQEIVEQVKQSTSLWTPLEVGENIFANFTEEDLIGLLGTIIEEPSGYPDVEVTATPDNFDSRTIWPSCVHPIRNQARCGSCWAFGASEAFSDRICIASGGKTNVVISAQDLVSCDRTNGGCKGGYLNKAWQYLEQHGAPADSCEPYASWKGKSPACPALCKDGSAIQKYKCMPGSLKEAKGADQIKSLILSSGPVETAFTVYADFFSYRHGIYHHVTGVKKGGHAVKIIGWGIDPTSQTNYWICANSWGGSWGEHGFFRIQQGNCGIDWAAWGCTPTSTPTVQELEFLQ